MSKRTVYTYADKQAIGTIEMTNQQYAQYVSESDQHTGAMLFSDLMAFGCEYVPSEIVAPNTTIYVEE